MVVATALARLRSILNETTAGFFADSTDLYPFLDSGQNLAIQLALTKERMARANGVNYKSPLLKPLIKLDSGNTTTTGSSYQEYAVPSDYLATFYAEYRYSTSDVTQKYPCAIVEFDMAAKRSFNTYAAAGGKDPVIYSSAEKIGFFPQATAGAANYYSHWYYGQPITVASGQEFVLREEAHEGILFIAVSLALSKDSNLKEDYFTRGINLLQGLT